MPYDIELSMHLFWHENYKYPVYIDGRMFPYYDGQKTAWMVFYSHNFSANNSRAAQGYEVTTDRGQSYMYEWDISRFLKGNEVKLKIRNINPKAPLVFKAHLQDQ